MLQCNAPHRPIHEYVSTRIDQEIVNERHFDEYPTFQRSSRRFVGHIQVLSKGK